MHAFSVIYTMLTYDGYPDNILPAYSKIMEIFINFLDYSKMYLFYFMVFLNLNIFLF
jgi:hypothetical protein